MNTPLHYIIWRFGIILFGNICGKYPCRRNFKCPSHHPHKLKKKHINCKNPSNKNHPHRIIKYRHSGKRSYFLLILSSAFSFQAVDNYNTNAIKLKIGQTKSESGHAKLRNAPPYKRPLFLNVYI